MIESYLKRNQYYGDENIKIKIDIYLLQAYAWLYGLESEDDVVFPIPIFNDISTNNESHSRHASKSGYFIKNRIIVNIQTSDRYYNYRPFELKQTNC